MIGPGLGLEIVSRVNDIPKGSRLAVSTNLLGSLISMCMRASGQVSQLTGALSEADRRIVAARAILGEWIGGSGGGWQDSGGIWPGIKMIQGTVAEEGDPEFGVSRGRLLPQPPMFLAAGDFRRDTAATAGQPGAGSWRDGSERRSDSGNGDGKISVAQRSRMGRSCDRHPLLDDIRELFEGRVISPELVGRRISIFVNPCRQLFPGAQPRTRNY